MNSIICQQNELLVSFWRCRAELAEVEMSSDRGRNSTPL